jgi:hypothetical protein
MEKFFENQKVKGIAANKEIFEGRIHYKYNKNTKMKEAIVTADTGEFTYADELFNLRIVGKNLREDMQNQIDSFIDQFDPEKLKNMPEADKKALKDETIQTLGKDAENNEEEVESMINAKLAATEMNNSSDSKSNILAKYMKESKKSKKEAKEEKVGFIEFDEDTGRYFFELEDKKLHLKEHLVTDWITNNSDNYILKDEGEGYLKIKEALTKVKNHKNIEVYKLQEDFEDEEYDDEDYYDDDDDDEVFNDEEDGVIETYNMYDYNYPSDKEVIEEVKEKMASTRDNAALVGYIQTRLECDEEEAKELLGQAEKELENSAYDALSVEEELDEVLSEYSESNNSNNIEHLFEKSLSHFQIEHLKESILEKSKNDYTEAFMVLKEAAEIKRKKAKTVSPTQFRECILRRLQEEQFDELFTMPIEEQPELINDIINTDVLNPGNSLALEDGSLVVDGEDLNTWVDEVVEPISVEVIADLEPEDPESKQIETGCDSIANCLKDTFDAYLNKYDYWEGGEIESI